MYQKEDLRQTEPTADLNRLTVWQDERVADFYGDELKRRGELFVYPRAINLAEWENDARPYDRIPVVYVKGKPAIGLNVPTHGRLIRLLEQNGFSQVLDTYHLTIIVNNGKVEKISINDFTPPSILVCQQVLEMLPAEVIDPDVEMEHGMKFLNLKTRVITWRERDNQKGLLEVIEMIKAKNGTLIKAFPEPEDKTLTAVQYLDPSFQV